MKCKRCGLNYKPGETSYDHTSCDEITGPTWDDSEPKKETAWDRLYSPEAVAKRQAANEEYQRRPLEKFELYEIEGALKSAIADTRKCAEADKLREQIQLAIKTLKEIK